MKYLRYSLFLPAFLLLGVGGVFSQRQVSPGAGASVKENPAMNTGGTIQRSQPGAITPHATKAYNNRVAKGQGQHTPSLMSDNVTKRKNGEAPMRNNLAGGNVNRRQATLQHATEAK